MILNVDGVAFAYNGRDVLRDIGFTVRRGDLLAILGPNGVGKTTLLRCMNAILKPHRGVVMVEDRDILGLSAIEIARRIGYVSQRQATARLTAFDAVLMGRRPRIRWRVSAEDLRIVDAAFRRLDLEHLTLRHIDQMSGGELQKVAIARAIVQEPRLLLLDEPTSSLDLRNQIEILELVRQVVREHAVAAVMTLHDLNLALRFADTYLFLKDGLIHAAGKTREVAAKTIADVYGVPVEIYHHHGRPVVIPLGGQ